MKKLAILILSALLAAVAFAAASITAIEGPALPWRVQVDLTFTDAGTVASASPQVFYSKKITVGDTVLTRDLGAITWDSVATKDSTVTITLADGTTATTTRGKVLAAVLAIAESERTK